MTAALILVPVVPFALAVLMAMLPPARRWTLRLAPLAAVPALVVSLLSGVVAPGEVPWLLLETRVGLDTTARVFLFLSAALWGLAGWYARAYLARDAHQVRFVAFYLLAMSGNFGLVVAQDLVTFYTSFALMTFAAAGLILHDATRLAVRATAVYVILAIVGEFLLLIGLFQAAIAAGGIELEGIPAAIADSGNAHLTVGFLFAGFGIKLGVPVLHMWLPLAHPAAPTPASAVLSGVMIKAGLLGWIRFLPLGTDGFEAWGWLCIVAGLSSAFLAVVIGLVQESPKVNLAYSSVSQMGIVTAAVGLGFLEAEAWSAILAVLLIYTLHHGFAKGALFLGVGIAGIVAESDRGRKVAFAGLGIAAISLAGAPFTSGALAKGLLKDELNVAGDWYGTLTWVVAFTSAATLLLMARFLVVVSKEMRERKHAPTAGLWAPWLAAVAATLFAAWASPTVFDLDIGTGKLFGAGKLWDASWPLAAGGVVALAAWSQRHRIARFEGSVPPGDVEVIAERAFQKVLRPGTVRTGGLIGEASLKWSTYSESATRMIASGWVGRAEMLLASWRILGFVLLGVTLTLVGLLSWPV
jgi:formate hydrogenlyase subunit 3/multisubunit Na+/H+ antiporter MnhD subunit